MNKVDEAKLCAAALKVRAKSYDELAADEREYFYNCLEQQWDFRAADALASERARRERLEAALRGLIDVSENMDGDVCKCDCEHCTANTRAALEQAHKALEDQE